MSVIDFPTSQVHLAQACSIRCAQKLFCQFIKISFRTKTRSTNSQGANNLPHLCETKQQSGKKSLNNLLRQSGTQHKPTSWALKVSKSLEDKKIKSLSWYWLWQQNLENFNIFANSYYKIFRQQLTSHVTSARHATAAGPRSKSTPASSAPWSPPCWCTDAWLSDWSPSSMSWLACCGETWSSRFLRVLGPGGLCVEHLASPSRPPWLSCGRMDE